MIARMQDRGIHLLFRCVLISVLLIIAGVGTATDSHAGGRPSWAPGKGGWKGTGNLLAPGESSVVPSYGCSGCRWTLTPVCTCLLYTSPSPRD